MSFSNNYGNFKFLILPVMYLFHTLIVVKSESWRCKVFLEKTESNNIIVISKLKKGNVKIDIIISRL